MSEAPAVLDLTVYQGAYWSQTLLWKDEAGNVIDLTGYTARMQIRKTVDATDVVKEITDGSGITLGPNTTPTPDYTILLELQADETAALPATLDDHKWKYDLELVPPGGKVVRLAMGKLIVSLEVTR